MLKKIYSLGFTYPKTIIITIVVLTALFASQLNKLHWETDARVYLPKGHPAIKYDEKVDEIFGVKDSLIITIVNNKEGIYNPVTLARVARIVKKCRELPGVISQNEADIASLASSTVFEGDNESMGSRVIMPKVPQTPEEMAALKKTIQEHKNILVGNIVSEDGKATMIRLKIKEGAQNRYMTYFQVKGIVALEKGENPTWGPWGGGAGKGKWGGNKWVNADGTRKKAVEDPSKKTDPNFSGNEWVNVNGTPKPTAQKKEKVEADWKGNKWLNANGTAKTDPNKADPNFAGNRFVQANGTPKPTAQQKEKVEADWKGNKWVNPDGTSKTKSDGAVASSAVNEQRADSPKPAAKKVAEVIPKAVNDVFYISGRPAIEVSSGLLAMEDMSYMVPLLIAAMAIVLLIIFRTWRGMLLPISVMAISIVWTFGLMALLNVPLYTISTMLPVILVAVSIGDAVHLLSSYYDKVLHNPQGDAKSLVSDATLKLGPPLVMTSVTTAIGFLSLLFAEMPPFRIFGGFALLGILFSWFITISLLPAVLTLLKPKVGNYLSKRRALRVYEEQNRLSLALTSTGRWIEYHHKPVFAGLVILVAVAILASSRLYVDSSWMSDFRNDTEIKQATNVVNKEFSGTIFLNIVLESKKKDAFKDPALLRKMDALESYLDTLPYVGKTIGLVDYIKTMNKVLHAENQDYYTIPESRKAVGEYLFLFSVSGRPQQLDEVVDFGYKRSLVTAIIKTDHTKALKNIIDSVKDYTKREFKDTGVTVNLAGSANNSYVWAKLLIDSQTTAILISKLMILIVAGLVFKSIVEGIFVVIPVTISTLLVAGFAGLFSIPLDVSTALAAGIAIGVGVDYAIHFIYRYISERKEGNEHIEALENTLRTTGHTIVLNAVVVIVGFSVLFFSQFPPHVKMGYFVTAYMVISCLVAIWVLPALISFFKPSFSQTKKT